MNKADFLRFVQHPGTIRPADVPALEEVIRAFPYFGLAHLLLAKAAHDSGDILAPQKLRKAAVYAPNRTLLKQLLYPEAALSAKITETQQSEPKPELSSLLVIPEPQPIISADNTKKADLTETVVPVTEDEVIAEEIALASEENQVNYSANENPITEQPLAEPAAEASETKLSNSTVLIADKQSLDVPAENTDQLAEKVESDVEVASLKSDSEPLPFSPAVEQEMNAGAASDASPGPDPEPDQADDIVTVHSNQKETEQIIAEEINAAVISEPLPDDSEAEETVAEKLLSNDLSAVEIETAAAPNPGQAGDQRSVDSESENELLEHTGTELGVQSEIGEIPALQFTEEEVSDPEKELRLVFADPQLGYALGSTRLGECWVSQAEMVSELPFYPQFAVPVRKESPQHALVMEEELGSGFPQVIAIQQELIDSFLKQSPRLRAQAANQLKPDAQEDLSAKSTKLSPAFASENLAQIFIKQGKPKKAIKIYQQLQLKMPEKSEYFANQILLLQQQF